MYEFDYKKNTEQGNIKLKDLKDNLEILAVAFSFKYSVLIYLSTIKILIKYKLIVLNIKLCD